MENRWSHYGLHGPKYGKYGLNIEPFRSVYPAIFDVNNCDNFIVSYLCVAMVLLKDNVALTHISLMSS